MKKQRIIKMTVCVYIDIHTHTARNEEFNSEAEEFRNYQSNFTND